MRNQTSILPIISLAITCLLLLFISPSSNALLFDGETEVEITANPHDHNSTLSSASSSSSSSSWGHCSSTNCVSNLQNLLDPAKIVMHVLKTQKDTLKEIEMVTLSKSSSSSSSSSSNIRTIPIYTFQQPDRISTRQLPFQLLLVTELTITAPHGITTVDQKTASDSWFPGYYWSVVVVCDCASFTFQHVGWKFTSEQDSYEESSFYALIVHLDKKETQQVRVFGMQAPGWMLTNMLEQNKNLTAPLVAVSKKS
jgi:hypothetical protein